MSKETSLMITARDNYSAAVTKMASNTRSMTKDVAGLSERISLLSKNKVTLQTDLTRAKRELDDAKRLFRDTGDEASRLDMEAKQADYNNIASNLRLVSSEAGKAERQLQNLGDEVSKQSNRAGSGGGSQSSLLSSLGKAGLTQMLGDTVSNAAGTLISSALGDAAGNMVNSVISKAASGAAIGTMIAPGIGTAIGAVAGGIAGAVDGAMQTFAAKDEAFKSTVQDSYEQVKQIQADALTSGLVTASGREVGLISWSTLLGGAGEAKSFLSNLKEMANTTPFEYDELDSMAKTLKTYGYTAKEILPTLTNIGDAGAALGLSTSDINMAATAIGRMKLTDKTALEYLNMLTERGIPAINYLASGLGKSKAEIYEMVSKGLIPGGEAAQIITDALGENFGGAMDTIAKTYTGLTSTLEDARTELDNAMGEGFSSKRKEGLENEIAFLSGETGEKMQEAYSRIGEWQASLENLKNQYNRDAITAVMGGELGIFEGTDLADRLTAMQEEYRAALASEEAGNTEAGAEMGRLIAEAQAMANAEYMASEGYQTELAANLNLIESIRSDSALNSSYYDAGYQLGQEFSKGRAAATSDTSWANTTINPRMASAVRGRGNAWGLPRVPYDNYPAILHEGEAVVPASTARGLGAGNGIVINISGLTVREEADVEKVARVLAREIGIARTVAI